MKKIVSVFLSVLILTSFTFSLFANAETVIPMPREIIRKSRIVHPLSAGVVKNETLETVYSDDITESDTITVYAPKSRATGSSTSNYKRKLRKPLAKQ